MTAPHEHDSVSDPAHSDETGHDWSDEGGALPDGPATQGAHTRGGPHPPNRNHAHGGLVDPRTAFPKIEPPEQQQPEPGLDQKLEPRAYRGEHTYRGSGRLRGRNALITGADSGIGAAVAIAFAREGANVALAYLPAEQPDAVEIDKILDETGVKVLHLPGDLADVSYRNTLVHKTLGAFGGLDILVNNAGKQLSVEDIDELSDEQIEQTFAVNVFATFALSRDAARVMEPGSTIINTTSIQAYSPSPHLLDYASTKAAVNNFTKGLAAQLGPKGIRVNAVAPGPIWTPLQPSHGQPPEKLPQFGHDTWLGRAGQPAELAAAYVYLASNESSYVVGETMHVNGGRATP